MNHSVWHQHCKMCQSRNEPAKTGPSAVLKQFTESTHDSVIDESDLIRTDDGRCSQGHRPVRMDRRCLQSQGLVKMCSGCSQTCLDGQEMFTGSVAGHDGQMFTGPQVRHGGQEMFHTASGWSRWTGDVYRATVWSRWTDVHTASGWSRWTGDVHRTTVWSGWTGDVYRASGWSR